MTQIIDKEINEELSESYLRYAGYVLQKRAIPDARDSLKDGARKILWSMLVNKHTPEKGRVKSNGAVGEVMKYSVHGDASILGTMMRLSQAYSVRYPLIDGQGNTGSIIAGDDFAAGRYTEVRTSKVAAEMMKNLDKEVVSFKENYDQTLLMPTVLPSYFPNFVNGATGIGVGAACSIPQFNINEVVDALVKMINSKEELSFEDIYCPIDFATGAIIVNEVEVKESLKNGVGASAKIRAVIEYDEKENQLIVKELPYQVFTDTISKQLADGINDGNITQVESFFDGTSFTGVNIKIKLYKKASLKKALEELYKFTSLQHHFSVNMVMLKNGKTPKVFGWKELLDTYLEHLQLMIKKSHQFDYNKLMDKIHIHEGYLIALADIDRIIQTIKSSDSTAMACSNLMNTYGLSEIQAKAILDMKLQRLTKLSAVEIEQKLNDFKTEAEEHKKIFTIKEELDKETIKELTEIKKKYGDKRRTKNLTLSLEDESIKVEEKNIIAYISNKGAIIAKELDDLVIQRRGTLGSKIKFTNKNDIIWKTIIGKTTDQVIVFTNKGKSYTISLSNIPIGEETYINQLLELEGLEYVTNILSYDQAKSYKYVIFATKNGIVKKTLLSEYLGSSRKTGLIAIKMREDDQLVTTQLIENENDKVMLTTKRGNCLVVDQKDIGATGRNTIGVKGINLSEADQLISMQIVEKDTVEVLTVSAQGYAKRTSIDEFSVGTRATKGTLVCKFKEENDYLADVVVLNKNSTELVVNSKLSSLKILIDTIPLQGKATVGVQTIKVLNNNLINNLILLEN